MDPRESLWGLIPSFPTSRTSQEVTVLARYHLAQRRLPPIAGATPIDRVSPIGSIPQEESTGVDVVGAPKDRAGDWGRKVLERHWKTS